MQVPYKNHTIVAAADELIDEPAEQHWRPWATVLPLTGAHPELEQLVFKERFATREEAEEYALVYAKQWIDDGKPARD
jgi:hypothetical protein